MRHYVYIGRGSIFGNPVAVGEQIPGRCIGAIPYLGKIVGPEPKETVTYNRR